MTLADKVQPRHTALLVVDVQRDYFCPGGIIEFMGNDPLPLRAMLDPLECFLVEARRLLDIVVFTRQTLYPYIRSPAVVEHYGRAGMSRPFDPSREEFYGVQPAEGDIILPKPKYSAFVGTHLDATLRANGIQTIIVTGVATNVCVESTVRHGFMLDYQMVVPSDLTAGVDDESKAMSLRNIGTFFGEVVTSDLITSAWASPPPADPSAS